MSKILVVEDDIPSGEILVQRLRHSGYEVQLAESGEQAQDTLATDTYDLVVVDFKLPGLDGWELIDWMRSLPANDIPKAVAITAYYDPVIASRATAAGFLHCFSKPATQDVVQQMKQFIDDVD